MALVLGTATGWAMLLVTGQWSLVLGADSSAEQCHWTLALGTGQWVLVGGACPGCPPGPAPHAWGSHSPKTIAGIASAVVLFIAIVTTIVCCFMCSCCYLYQRRQHLRTPLQGAGLGGEEGAGSPSRKRGRGGLVEFRGNGDLVEGCRDGGVQEKGIKRVLQVRRCRVKRTWGMGGCRNGGCRGKLECEGWAAGVGAAGGFLRYRMVGL